MNINPIILTLCSITLVFSSSNRLNKREEDALLDRMIAANRAEGGALAQRPVTEKPKAVTKAEIESTVEHFLSRCNPSICTVTQTGRVITGSKTCTKPQLDSVLTEAMVLNLNAVESLMNLAVGCKMRVSNRFTLQQNFAVLYISVAQIAKLTTPVTIGSYLTTRDLEQINQTTCDPKFLRLIDAAGPDYFMYANAIESGRYTTAPDGRDVTPENKLSLTADLFYKETRKRGSAWVLQSSYWLANMIFKNGLTVHPDGRTDISTKEKQAAVAAKLYWETEHFADVAGCLEFTSNHPDEEIDISTPQKQYTERARLYWDELNRKTRLHGFLPNPIVRDETFYNLAACIISGYVTIDPETKAPITKANRVTLASKYWWQSNLAIAKEQVVYGILSGELSIHPDGSGRIQDIYAASYEILERAQSKHVNRNISRWMLIANNKIDRYPGENLRTEEGRRQAILNDFLKLSPVEQENPRLHFALGIALSDLKFFKEAIPYLEKALSDGYDAVNLLSLCKYESMIAELMKEDASEGSEVSSEDTDVSEEAMRLWTEENRKQKETERLEKARILALKKARILALKKAEKKVGLERLQSEKGRASEALRSNPPSFKIPLTSIVLAPRVDAQKDKIEAILPGKADAIMQELMETGHPRQTKCLGRHSQCGNQLLFEVKMNDAERLFYSRSEDGVVTIHQIGGHTAD